MQMKKCLLTTIAAFICMAMLAQVPKDYEISCAGNAVQGNYLISVSYKSKSKKPDDTKLRLAAIHGVIFRGITSSNSGCKSQKPLVKDLSAEQDHADFFEMFFNDKAGRAVSFANVQLGSYQVVKVKGGYRITAVVTVSKDQLRKHLEDAGIIKSLSSGF